MKDFFSKLSLYDFLTTVLLGGFVHFILLLPHSNLFSGCILDYIHNYIQSINDICIIRSSSSSDNYFWVLILLYYFIGLIIHRTVEWVDCSFLVKNNKRGIIISSLLSVVCRNTRSIIRYSLEKTLEENPNNTNNTLMNTYGDSDMMYHYNEAYYKLLYSERLNNIPKVEAISAFAKDLLFVISIISICRLRNGFFYCGNLLILILIIVLLIIIRYNCERIISRLVWEGFFYGCSYICNNGNTSCSINSKTTSVNASGVNVKMSVNKTSVSANADNGNICCSVSC